LWLFALVSSEDKLNDNLLETTQLIPLETKQINQQFATQCVARAAHALEIKRPRRIAAERALVNPL
jgi:hypothetical protein